MQRTICRFVLAAAMTVSFGAYALAQEYSSWSAHGSITLKGGTERHIGEFDLFVPLWQDDNSLFFADLRAQSDDSDNQEGNAGFGFRRMGENWIVGGYGFFDWRKSDETGNKFIQGMVGFEAMSERFDLRINGYLPEDEEKLAPGMTTLELVGSSLQMRAGQERALPGADAEIGYRLWGSRSGEAELRAFAGGYYFDADDYRTVAGPRGRVEVRLFNIGFLGAGSRFTLGAEVTNDSVRDTQSFAMARVTIPFGGGRRSAKGGLDRRMADYVVRDVDIVTAVGATGAAEGVAYVYTGVTVGEVWLLDGGDNIVAATAGGGEGDLFVMDGSAGDFATNESTVLGAGQVLLGGGGSLDLVGLNSGARATYTAPGARPTINGDVDGAAVVILADDTMVTGLDIENISPVNFSNGISGEGVTGTLVTGNVITLSAYNVFGVHLSSASSDNLISDNNIVANENTGDSSILKVGVFLQDSDNNTVSGNSIETDGNTAIGVYVLNSDSNTITDNSIEMSAEFSVFGVYLNKSSASTISGNSIVVGGDVGYGLLIIEGSTNTVSGNSIETSGDNVSGVHVTESRFSTITGNVIVTSGALAPGLYMLKSGQSTVSGNTITTAGFDAHGLIVLVSSGNTISDNTIVTTGDDADGMFLSDFNANIVSGNSVTTGGAGAYGIYLNDAASNTFDNNVIVTGQADAPGFYLIESLGVVENNTGTGNSYTGPADDCFVDASVTGPNTIDLCP